MMKGPILVLEHKMGNIFMKTRFQGKWTPIQFKNLEIWQIIDFQAEETFLS